NDMRSGDELLIVKGETIKLLGEVAEKVISRDLSLELWKDLREDSQTWDLIYFIANLREINLPFSEFCALIGYKPNFQLHGFTKVSRGRTNTFYSRHSDLYSTL